MEFGGVSEATVFGLKWSEPIHHTQQQGKTLLSQQRLGYD